MIRIALDEPIICERGTTTAVIDYATALINCGLATPTILYNEKLTGDSPALSRIDRRIPLEPYHDDTSRNRIVTRLGPDLYYYLKVDANGKRQFAGQRVGCHIVFDFLPLQGCTSAYVSSWLSDFVSGGRVPTVPHIVQLPKPDRSLRNELRVPDDAVLIGRHGGYDTFDLPFVIYGIAEALQRRSDLWFIFVNTRPFINHERVLFLPPILDLQLKVNFIESCDAMLHGRSRGESFGLAIAEFLYMNKPVFCWRGGQDRNHLRLQPEPENVYSTGGELVKMLLAFRVSQNSDRSSRVLREYAPEVVIRQFVKVFIEEQESTYLAGVSKIYYDTRRRILKRARRMADQHSIRSPMQLPEQIQPVYSSETSDLLFQAHQTISDAKAESGG